MLMLMVILLFNATPAAPSAGTNEVTEGRVVSGVDEALVVNVVGVNGVNALPSISRRPLIEIV